MMPKITTERGQVLIIIALAMIGLTAMVGLAIDSGAKFSDMRQAQNAADTAAMAAALAKVDTLAEAAKPGSTIKTVPAQCPPPTGVTPSDVCTALLNAGYFRATSNGYVGDLVTNTVEIYSPPVSGFYEDDEDYVQVIITSFVNTTFARVIGFDRFTNHVQAVAYAKPGYNLANGAMIISYDPDPNCSVSGTGGYSVEVAGDATINLIGGGIFLNSDEVCGFKIPSCADLNITSLPGVPSGISSVGADNIDQEGCATQAPEIPNQHPVIIPDEVYWPPVPIECSMSGSKAPTFLGEVVVAGKPKPVEEWLIYPGFYPEFPQATLLPTEEEVAVGKSSRIYMASGVYCIDPPMDKDLEWSPVAASLLNGSTDPTQNRFQDPSSPDFKNFNPNGVTLYIRAGGGFSINVNSPTFLDASNNPSGPNGDYQGYLIILEGTPTEHPTCTINGGAEVDINGLIFAPYCNFTINGKAGETASFNAQLIGWDLKINGTNEINFKYDPSNQVKIKRKVGLMK